MIWLGLSGAHRSGTTILAHILNQHPEVGLFVEYGLERYVRSIDSIFARSDEIDDYDERVDRSRREAAAAPPSSVEALTDAFYQQREEAIGLAHTGPFRPLRRSHDQAMLLAAFQLVFPGRDLRVVGDKTPQFLEKNDPVWLRQRLPTFRLLHIVRNPLDVINSSIRRRNKTRSGKDSWHVTTVDQAASEWITDWNQSMAAKAVMGDDMMIVKYEDMARDTAAVLQRIEMFLGLSQPLLPAFAPIPETLRLLAMTAEERAQARAWFRVITDAWLDHDPAALAALFPYLPPVCRTGESLDFRVGGNAKSYLVSGFSTPESDGTWTDNECAEVAANFGLETQKCCLTGAFIPIASCQRLRVSVNGVVAGTVMTGAPVWQERTFSLDIDHAPAASGGTVVRFEPDRPKLPEEAPKEDFRRLGILLKSICLQPMA